ncbi:MAG: phospho-N-acetylmuramoyl-pentapeptide-transferase, partial [Oscillospiraceae bacterium]|nr:phospho-N-acetylmuramoyl-pentapeptide-transferase [Oscillospiraceae bacterium]
ILYLVNAVNLTDGIDGLCSSVTVVYMATFAVISGMLGMFGETLLTMCTAGACIGFLMWNFPPAKVFMGDTGSMFLGGVVCAVGVGCGCEVLMIIAALVYILEALSVVIQVTVFKITKKIHHTKEGKRLFKMTPIHHHFELSGWSEIKIDAVFSAAALVLGIAAVLLVRVMY